ncbi:MAG: biotin transporter BioY, partial [Clostridiales bacterium]|nr:biotin transporter BioY [Clostridiales bacterium]
MKFTSKDLTLTSLFVALITIGSKITIPSPIVPFTLQW